MIDTTALNIWQPCATWKFNKIEIFWSMNARNEYLHALNCHPHMARVHGAERIIYNIIRQYWGTRKEEKLM